jgi:leader peptidase (prepilin peptidase) / N-methyltransferase
MNLDNLAPILIPGAWAIVGAVVALPAQALIVTLPGAARLRHTNAGLAASRPLLACILAAAFGWLAWRYGLSWTTLVFSIYAFLFVVMCAIDIRHHLIQNAVIAPALVFALLASFVVPRMDPPKAIAGAIAGFLLLLLPALVVPGGLGGGDVTLAGFLGMAVGFPGVFVALAAGIIIAGVTTLGLLLARRIGRRDFIPYGPFLISGAILVLLIR